jgi:hypothetical protein
LASFFNFLLEYGTSAYIIIRVFTLLFALLIFICWSPNWNEPQTDSGTPRFGNRFGESLFRYGDPRSDMGSPF